MICFTHGEASTLSQRVAGLRQVRAGELAAAAAVPGIIGTTLRDYPDGHLAGIPLPLLAGPAIGIAGVSARHWRRAWLA